MTQYPSAPSSDTLERLFEAGYRPEGVLGQGGFGVVYRATQQTTGQSVAVKLLRLRDAPHRSVEDQLARFRREMRLCAQLHHPNIVRLIDSGQIDEFSLYTVFEYVPGNNLSKLLKRDGAFEPREACHLMAQVLDALACAHAKGVIHRDLKPANIMLNGEGARRNAMVLDFGVATVIEGALTETEQEPLTGTYDVVGTPAYAAPEQLRSERTSPRSDLYSWGLIFLECLTGVAAYHGAVGQIVIDQLGSPLELPPSLRRHPLGRIIEAATQQDIVARDVTAAGLLAAVDMASQRTLHPIPDVKRTTGSAQLSKTHSNSGALFEDVSGDDPTHLVVSDSLEISGERRQITALCCRLRFETQGPPLDLEVYDNILRAQQELCVEIAGRFDGYIAGSVGERVLIYFGYPRAREDDVIRAVQAARELIGEVKLRSHQLKRTHPTAELTAQIGMHTGPIVAQRFGVSSSRGVSEVVGATPNIAVELDRQAAPNEVVLSEATAELITGRFELEAEGLFNARGVSLKTFRLGGARSSTLFSGQISHVASKTLPIQGRAQEIGLLDQRYQRACAGEGQGVLVTGEAGVGKSRLLMAFHQSRSGPVRWLECRCARANQNTPLQPLIDLLEQQLIDVGAEASEDETLAGLMALLERLEFDPAKHLPLLCPLLHLRLPEGVMPAMHSPQRHRELTVQSLTSLLFELSDESPLCIIAEDLHWADASTLEVFGAILGDIDTSQLFVALTTRPEFEPTWSGNLTRLHLTHLDARGARGMIEAIAGSSALTEAVVDQIIERADGVPLFIEELTRVVLASVDDSSTTTSVTRIDIPNTLRDALMARIDRLGPARNTIHIASAIGRDFSYPLLKKVARIKDQDLEWHLESLVAADLIRRRRRRGSLHYIFKHALVQEIAHEAMVKATRKQIHARIAVVLTADHELEIENHPERLARHLSEAEEMAQAVRYAERAAKQAMTRFANVEASRIAAQALGWLEGVEDERLRAELELRLNGVLVKTLMFSQGYGAVDIKEIVARSQVLIDRLRGSQHLFSNLWALAAYHYMNGDLVTALKQADHLLALAEVEANQSRQVAALALLGQFHYFQGDFEASGQHLERCLELHDPVAHYDHLFTYGLDSKILALGHLCSVEAVRGDIDRGREHLRTLEATASATGIPHLICSELFGQAAFHHLIGERAPILEVVTRLDALVAEHGPNWLETYIRLFACWASHDLDAAQGLLYGLLNFGGGVSSAFWKTLVADIQMERGLLDEALANLEWSVDNHGDGSTYYLAEMHRLRGDILALKSDREGAVEALELAASLARESGMTLFEQRATTRLSSLTSARE